MGSLFRKNVLSGVYYEICTRTGFLEYNGYLSIKRVEQYILFRPHVKKDTSLRSDYGRLLNNRNELQNENRK